MVNFSDRVVMYPNRYQINNVEGFENIKELIPVPGDVATEGTPLNRSTFMAVQGFEAVTTVFLDDGRIVETYPTGTKTTVFNDDGTIEETFVGEDGARITRKTSFADEGIISEVIL